MRESFHTPRIFDTVKRRLSSFSQRGITRPLLIIVLIGLVEGMLCFIAIPPWWHYDEPGHFEYAWLVAHSPKWPVQGQYDQAMRKDMAESMIRVGWYRIRNFKVNLSGSEPIQIGVTQVGDEPGYYFLASLPLRLISNADITVQYYVARFVSLLLYLLIIVAVWYAGGQILQQDLPLRWMTTVFVALLPAFADTMVSVNNDVSAVLAASFFLWASLRLIQKGFSLGRLGFLAVTLIGCYISKSTAWFVFPLAPLVLVLALLRGRLVWIIWGVAALLLIAGVSLSLSWGGPQAWYQPITSDTSVRAQTKNAVSGEYAFQFDASTASNVNQLLQILSPEQVKALRGKTATLGAWAWADRATHAGPLYVSFITQSGDVFSSPRMVIAVTSEPTFQAIDFVVPADAVNGTVYIQQTRTSRTNLNVFFDGLVLALGKFDSTPPQFSDASTSTGSWDGLKFRNFLRNGSAEESSVGLQKWVNDKTGTVLAKSSINLPLVLVTIQDWNGTGWYYRGALGTLFRTFWASLAGDKAFLASAYVSYLLVLLTFIALAGAAVRLWRKRKQLRWDVIGFLALALVLPWLLAVVRGSSTFLQTNPLAPWARYAYPAIFPTALLLCAGWLEWLEILPGARELTTETRKIIFFSMMAGISIFTIINAIQAFHPEWWYGWVSLGLLFLFQYVIFHFARKRETFLGS